MEGSVSVMEEKPGEEDVYRPGRRRDTLLVQPKDGHGLCPVTCRVQAKGLEGETAVVLFNSRDQFSAIFC